MFDERARILKKETFNDRYVLFRLYAPKIAAAARPGNFVMVRVRSEPDPALRRPLGILHAENSEIWLYFNIAGRGTSILADCRDDAEISVLGPCGNTFPEINVNEKKILLIAGGRGIVPLFFFLKNSSRLGNTLLLWGGARSCDFALIDLLREIPGIQVRIYSEDGSIGEQGLVTRDLHRIIEEFRPDFTLSCGPEGLFKALSIHPAIAASDNLVSTESLMGCGFGICHSCALETTSGYKMACKDGPVFRLEEIKWI